MRVYVRIDDGVCSEWFKVAQETSSRMRVFAAVVQCLLPCDSPRHTSNGEIQRGSRCSHKSCPPKEQPSKVGPETALKCVQRASWGVLYADDACIVSRSPRGLERMLAVFVKIFGAFGLTFYKRKTKTTCMPTPRAPATQIVRNATG